MINAPKSHGHMLGERTRPRVRFAAPTRRTLFPKLNLEGCGRSAWDEHPRPMPSMAPHPERALENMLSTRHGVVYSCNSERPDRLYNQLYAKPVKPSQYPRGRFHCHPNGGPHREVPHLFTPIYVLSRLFTPIQGVGEGGMRHFRGLQTLPVSAPAASLCLCGSGQNIKKSGVSHRIPTAAH